MSQEDRTIAQVRVINMPQFHGLNPADSIYTLGDFLTSDKSEKIERIEKRLDMPGHMSMLERIYIYDNHGKLILEVPAQHCVILYR